MQNRNRSAPGFVVRSESPLHRRRDPQQHRAAPSEATQGDTPGRGADVGGASAVDVERPFVADGHQRALELRQGHTTTERPAGNRGNARHAIAHADRNARGVLLPTRKARNHAAAVQHHGKKPTNRPREPGRRIALTKHDQIGGRAPADRPVPIDRGFQNDTVSDDQPDRLPGTARGSSVRRWCDHDAGGRYLNPIGLVHENIERGVRYANLPKFTLCGAVIDRRTRSGNHHGAHDRGPQPRTGRSQGRTRRRSRGNSDASLTLLRPRICWVRRSRPIANPPCGGQPY